MVTIGFIVEGDSEAILLKDNGFINLLNKLQLFCSKDLVINAGGKDKIYNRNAQFSKELETRVNGWIETLLDKNVETIFILLDFDNSDVDYTTFKQKVYHRSNNIVIIAKQALEAWYLADTKALNSYLETENVIIESPEDFLLPFDEIKKLKLLHLKKGVSDKKILTRHFINHSFDLTNAANHPNCSSAKYFLQKLSEVAANNAQ